MLTQFLLSQLVHNIKPYKRRIEQDTVIVANYEPVKPLTFNYELKDEIDYQSPVVEPVNTSGNLYEPGQCVWGVKEWRPDIPGNWGNAFQWLGNAQQSGWATGPTPRVNAVGTENNHVVLVTAVYGDGTIQIREMNYDYVPFHERYRVALATEFYYIY